MQNQNDLVVTIKSAAMGAVDSSKQAGVVFGKVIGVEPLKIKIDQKLTLSQAQLILCRNVTTHLLNITVNTFSENAVHNHPYTDNGSMMATEDNTHNHQIIGTKTITVHNGLVVGDLVAMIQMQGGQKFLVMDRVKL